LAAGALSSNLDGADYSNGVIPFLIFLAALPFILPIVSLIRQSRLLTRMSRLEEEIERQRRTITDLSKRVDEARSEKAQRTVTAPAPTVAAPAPPAPPKPPAPAPIPKPAIPPGAAKPAAVTPAVSRDATPPPPRTPPPSPPVPSRTPPPPPPFDWERLIGVKMFSAVAGVALVLAAVFFLRYSIDHGWLAPPVRVAIGLLTGVTLLVACDLRAARKYPVTANALDAAAIAILFSTFFAAHAIWHLIPAAVAFALLALVTAVAVLLSIRRASLFIAVLGLLGGFATPILLSTGENRPIPLFTYLLLLNIGLAWVAHKKRWPLLTLLSVAFTTIYQWGWVVSFLTASQLSLAMGLFLVFSVVGFASIVFSAPLPAGGRRSVSNASLAAASMPLAFAAYLAAVPAYGSQPGLLFGFLFIVNAGLLALTIARGEEWPHALGASATLVVFATWLAVSYAHGAFATAVAFVSAFILFFALAPVCARRFHRPLPGVSARAIYAAPVLFAVFAAIARIEPSAAAPAPLFAPLLALLAIVAWQAFARREFPLYYVAAFFATVAEATWSATHLTADHLAAAFVLYGAFGALYIVVPLIARRADVPMLPRWAGGAVLIASLLLLLFLAGGPHAAAALWGLAILVATLNAGLFVESAAGGLPALSVVGGGLSWLVLAVWWSDAAAIAGLLPSLLFLVTLTLTMLAGHAWGHRATRGRSDVDASRFGFRHGAYLGVLGHLFLLLIAIDPRWSIPPWPLFGALTVLTLALTAASLAIRSGELHAAGTIAASIVLLAWARAAGSQWAPVFVVATEILVAYALGWFIAMRKRGSWTLAAAAAICALFIANFTIGEAPGGLNPLPIGIVAAVSALNIALIFAVAWTARLNWIAPASVVTAWYVQTSWHDHYGNPAEWMSSLVLAVVLYAVFVGYPFVLGRRARPSRDPYLAAIAGSAFAFFAARTALLQGGYGLFVGAVPVAEGAVMALLLRQLLRMEPDGARDLARLALIAGTALAFVTIAIPLQLNHQWITIGWALEGAALAWVYRRIPHRGLLYWSAALLAVVFVRLAMNPSVFVYEPRGLRVFNWYLYTYAICAVSMFAAAWWLSKTDDKIRSLPRASYMLPAGAVILLFMLLNIEIADFYATGREIAFRFGVTLAQDLTYTIGWLAFGMLLLTGGIYLRNRPARVTAVVLITVTAFKAFLYDTGSLGGLYRVGSLAGLAISLSLVALALQKFVLHPAGDHA